MKISDLKNNSLFRERCYINGEWVNAVDTIKVTNPANDEILGQVPDLDAEGIETAIATANMAFHRWRRTTADARAQILQRWYELMMENQEDLAALMTLEQGKPLSESRGEIAYAAGFLRWFSGEAPRAYGDTIPAARESQHIIVIKQPAGVAAAITPWNFPAAMITRKAGAALAAGCTMVVKPASETPFSALALAQLGEEAGLPAGVFNVITGKASDIGKALTGSPDVRKISFTGSTEVGRILMQQSAEHIQKVSLELGGNAPFIVFDDADLARAVEGAMASKFRNTGQTCVCTNRFLVQDAVHDEFVHRMKSAIEQLKVGDGFDNDVDQSVLINKAAVEKFNEHITNALDGGATLVTGGKPHPLGGNYVTPTLISGIKADMLVCREETFGPLAAVMTFRNEQEALDKANDTPFGLAAYFYSRDIHRIWRVAEALESGMVGINEGLISNPAAPFGGVKESGLGREGSWYGIDEYLEVKYLCMGGE